MKCRHHLPLARHGKENNNPAAQVFWGRVPLRNVFTSFLYTKGNAVQQLVHAFKYNGRKDTGFFLGEELGKIIKASGQVNEIDFIVPVPLHARKKKKRGFNQSEIISGGIASVIDKEVKPEILFRKSYSSTQTKKSKYQRWENVESIFTVKNPSVIENKHLLLVDDVITTGATIEACAHALLKVGGVELSVGAVAYTRG
jgi:ComF family protein